MRKKGPKGGILSDDCSKIGSKNITNFSRVDEIYKSQRDERQYRYVELRNGMKVTFVQLVE